jgi:glucosylceramidase
MKNVKVYETSFQKGKYWEESLISEVTSPKEMNQVVIYPQKEITSVRGFGGAFTEAAAHTWSGLGPDKRAEVIEDIFGESGLRYTLGRIHMNSCDFALGNYHYIDEGDESLDSFDMSHDDQEIIPMLQAATDKIGSQPVLMMAPWSPPPFMKTNGEMNHGGKLKKEYYELWARYFVRFIREYKERGFDISFTTVQNEPNAVQTWDSCQYNAEEEEDFAVNYLGPALKEAGLLDKVKIFVWDHNKELAYDRFKEIMDRPSAGDYISGCAVHWYTGDHFDNVRFIKEDFPGKEVFFTEGCVEYSRLSGAGDVSYAEMYAHDMMGNLTAGISAIFDWNLILDHKGGPNHVGNFCDAPLKANEAGDDYEKKLSYYYIGHISRYVKPGAKVVRHSRYTDKVDVATFVNPDGERVVVFLNRTDGEISLNIREAQSSAELTLAPHSIKTITYNA